MKYADIPLNFSDIPLFCAILLIAMKMIEADSLMAPDYPFTQICCAIFFKLMFVTPVRPCFLLFTWVSSEISFPNQFVISPPTMPNSVQSLCL